MNVSTDLLDVQTLTAEGLKSALEALPSITRVEVDRFNFVDNDRLFSVTFIEPYGDVELLKIDDTLLEGTSNAVAVSEEDRKSVV